MEFNYTEEQQLLVDAARRFIEDNCSIEARRRAMAQEKGFDVATWRGLSELGITGLPIAVDVGGLGGSGYDVMLVAIELGRGLSPEPFISSCIVAASAISAAAVSQARDELLRQIADGSAVIVLAHAEQGHRYDLVSPQTTAELFNDAWFISGRKSLVLDGAGATQFLVTATAATGEELLLVIDADTPGMTVRSFPTIDGRRVSELEMNRVEVDANQLLMRGESVRSSVKQALRRGTAGLCAEALGAMEQLCLVTASYMRTRQQFKQPLASFQALQHRYADMLIALEQARSAAFMAAAAIDDMDDNDASATIAAAKFLTGKSARFIGEQAVQLHGGIGMTAELEVGDYFKRLSVIDLTWGNSDHQLALYANLLT
ncbi:acyl-CoA dehydrogenase family protein [Variovorax sp. VNK109]|uniref:acyl-CoA dehydrogenase family protein n=1 Tax=Variovorax sp. VNK109 TaxID=3400919 RepID=UPI003C00B169